ncbi:MAG: type II 3-dehydroquinate dehydratase [FCB group bacterium]|nr:type II 3-dehydroquinate dehydratase [FCB group bacterium]
MKNKQEKIRILVLHGPNLNLLGLRSARLGTRATLDKVNRALRREVRNTAFELKIFQTNSESAASIIIQRNRNKAAGILLAPESWRHGAYVLADTLDLIGLPLITVYFQPPQKTVFSSQGESIHTDPVGAYLAALEQMMTLLKRRS